MFFNVNDPKMLKLDPQFETNGQAQAIRDAIKTAYYCSLTFCQMVDDWLNCNSSPITIEYAYNDFWAKRGMGIILIDLNYLTPLAYINNNGTAVKTTADMAIVHELVHALQGLSDNAINPNVFVSGVVTDYRQPNVTYSNIIYKELGLPEQNSYIAHNEIGDILNLGFQYTNGAAIDRSVARDDNWDSSNVGNSNDLLIGGISSNTLKAGDGNDFLYGNGGKDTLEGGSGNDLLNGGADDDTLDGGDDFDTYILEGRDTIRDSDGKGILKDKAGNIITGVIEKKTDGSYTYLTDPGITVTKDTNLTLTLADGTVAIIENFQDGDLGFLLYDKPVAPATSTTITGDIKPEDGNPEMEGIQASYDYWQSFLIGTAEAHGDVCLGTPGNDHISAGELNDAVSGLGGSDWIEGGNGNDYLHVGHFGVGGNYSGREGGQDLIEGGAGSDIMDGGEDSDQLYGNVKIETAAAIDNGNSQGGSGAQGDWLAGGNGDDLLVAGDSNDMLSGGAGADLIVAGAGNDYIFGDGDYLPVYLGLYEYQALPPRNSGLVSGPGQDPLWNFNPVINETFNWSVTPDGIVSAMCVVDNTPAGGAADIIYAGNGDDHVWAGVGDDIVYGEAGAAKLVGDEGDDTLQYEFAVLFGREMREAANDARMRRAA